MGPDRVLVTLAEILGRIAEDQTDAPITMLRSTAIHLER